jgi:ribonuclease D
LGYGDQPSLRSLLEVILGEQLEKGHAFTDWLRRPLSSGQIEYALNDVRHLGRLYELLYKMLREAGRLEWAQEEFKLLETAERFLPIDDRQAYTLLKGAERLSQASLGLLQELASWRELKARRLNVPLGRIAIDPVLMELAMRPPSAVRQLAQMRGLNSRQAEEYGPEIIEALRRGVRNAPQAIKQADPFPAALEATVDFLSLCMRALAREQSISTGILANRSGLRLLVTLGENADIPLLRGWRRQSVGTALLSALQGDVAVSIVAATKQVNLQWQSSSGTASGSPHSPDN